MLDSINLRRDSIDKPKFANNPKSRQLRSILSHNRGQTGDTEEIFRKGDGARCS